MLAVVVAADPVILGRRTFDTMRDDLPGSEQMVVSQSLTTVDVSTARVVSGVDEAIAALDETDTSVGYVLGGGAIYRLFQPHVDRMTLSHVPGEYEGDAVYPAWDEAEWTVVREAPHDGFTLREWVRQGSQRPER